jgi:hypothetical protein
LDTNIFDDEDGNSIHLQFGLVGLGLYPVWFLLVINVGIDLFSCNTAAELSDDFLNL